MTDFHPLEYSGEMTRMSVMIPLILQCKPADCLNYINHVHSIGPILDPTAYRKGMDNLDVAAHVCRAILAAQRELAPIREKLEAAIAAHEALPPVAIPSSGRE